MPRRSSAAIPIRHRLLQLCHRKDRPLLPRVDLTHHAPHCSSSSLSTVNTPSPSNSNAMSPCPHRHRKLLLASRATPHGYMASMSHWLSSASRPPLPCIRSKVKCSRSRCRRNFSVRSGASVCFSLGLFINTPLWCYCSFPVFDILKSMSGCPFLPFWYSFAVSPIPGVCILKHMSSISFNSFFPSFQPPCLYTMSMIFLFVPTVGSSSRHTKVSTHI